MKPIYTTLIIVAVGALIAYGIWYYFSQKTPAFDIAAYNRLGNQGILQGNGDYPYCPNCKSNGGGGDAVGNSINYAASGYVADPTFIAQQRAAQMMS